MEPVEKKLKSPKSVWFIVCNELCERFNYYGLRTILVLYLTTELEYSADGSTMIYHGFIFLSYFMPLFGAIVADSYWGKFKTIIRLSMVYALGNIILTGSSMTDYFTLNFQRCLSIVGLILISIGTGGIKPCCYTFGGDQFQLPEQQDQLANFFNRFILAIYAGAFISTFFAPELRKIPCFGMETCFPLAFGVLSLLMVSAIVVFIVGRKMYVKRKPENHVIFKTFGCIFYAARRKITSSASDKKSHWLDHASDKYHEIEVADTKAALDVLYTFVAYPVFWALYEQLGSRWTLQATLMNGKIEGTGWEIKPDQMQSIHPLIALLLTLSFDSILFPLLAKFGIRKPLQKLVFSNSIAAIAFFCSAILQNNIFGEGTVIPADMSRFTVYNGFDCNVSVNYSSPMDSTAVVIGPLGSANFMYTPPNSGVIDNVMLNFEQDCDMTPTGMDTNVTVARGESISYFLTNTVVPYGLDKKMVLRRIDRFDDFTKPKSGHPKLRIIIDNSVNADEYSALAIVKTKSSMSYKMSSFSDERFQEVQHGNYIFMHREKTFSPNVHLKPATIYTLVVRNYSRTMDYTLYATDEGNYLHILWQVPQYTFMILADVIFIATTIEFSFTEAPPRIKSFISSCYSMTQSIGNLIVVIISAMSFHKQVHEYLFFSGLMLVDTLLLVYLSRSYQYKNFKQRLGDDGFKIAENKTEHRNGIQLTESDRSSERQHNIS